MNTCCDCGAPVVERTSGFPAQTVMMSKRGERYIYHDNSECIFFLKGKIDALAIQIVALIEAAKK